MDNLTNLTNAKNFYDVAKFSNDATNGVMGWMLVTFLLIMFTLMFLRRYTFEESVLASSFLVFAISIFLRTMGLITSSPIFFLGIFVGFSGLWVYLSKKA